MSIYDVSDRKFGGGVDASSKDWMESWYPVGPFFKTDRPKDWYQVNSQDGAQVVDDLKAKDSPWIVPSMTATLNSQLNPSEVKVPGVESQHKDAYFGRTNLTYLDFWHKVGSYDFG